MLPDNPHSRISNDVWFKVTAATCRKVEISNSLAVTKICDPLKSGALHNHFYFTLSKHNYCLRVDSKSGK